MTLENKLISLDLESEEKERRECVHGVEYVGIGSWGKLFTSLEPSTSTIPSSGPLSFLDLCHGLLMEFSASISAYSQFFTQESE